MSEVVYVTNRSDKKLVADFSYQKYEFPVNETKEISVLAAKHIFGFGDNNKEPYLTSLGWIRFHSDLEQGLEKLEKFEISHVAPQQNRSLPSAVGVVPLHVEKRAGGKSSQARAA
jgi:hypothetical protein